MKDKTSATGVMVAHLAYIQLVEVRFFGRRPTSFHIVLPPAGVGGMTSIKTHHPSFHGAIV